VIVSVHIAEVGAREAAEVLLRPPRPGRVPGLTYVETTTTAALGEPLLPPKHLRRVGMIAAWDDDAALDAFCRRHPLARHLAGGWRVRLQPLRISGAWAGMPGAAGAGAPCRRRRAGRGPHPRPPAPAPHRRLPPQRRPRRGGRDREPGAACRNGAGAAAAPGGDLQPLAQRRGDAPLRLRAGSGAPRRDGGGPRKAVPPRIGLRALPPLRVERQLGWPRPARGPSTYADRLRLSRESGRG